MSSVIESPRGTCVLGGINNVLSAVSRLCPIYHSGPGCCMQTSIGEAGQAGLRSPHFLSGVSTPCSNMLEREVVFGGEQKLRDEIDGALEIIDADAYFVLTGCTAGIIGDDIASITREYSDRGLPVYPITTPGFAGDSLLGFEVAFEAFLDFVVEKGLPRQGDLVNLIGVVPYHDPHWSGTLEELTRILRKLGLRVNTFFTENQGLAEVKSSGSAALNIIVSSHLLKKTAERYEAEHGVPHLRVPYLPIGASLTTNFVRAVGEKLGLSSELVESVIFDEESYVYHYYESIVGGLGWKRFAVVADGSAAVGVTRFLADDFGMTPVVTIISEPIFRTEDRERIEAGIRAVEYAKAPDIFFQPDHYEIRKKIKEYDGITLLIGSSLEQEVALELGIQCHVMVFPTSDRLVLNRTYAGYRGALTIIEDLFNNL
ncbi:MAG: nitrogen fixation protein NifK [Oscillospiraceae bacterium]|jgi:nitrogenase molybdenum-iron protein beta chain|nr:nitrogen fixation protein NifK [Oscillospiraceae bacterium]